MQSTVCPMMMKVCTAGGPVVEGPCQGLAGSAVTAWRVGLIMWCVRLHLTDTSHWGVKPGPEHTCARAVCALVCACMCGMRVGCGGGGDEGQDRKWPIQPHIQAERVQVPVGQGLGCPRRDGDSALRVRTWLGTHH